MSEYERAFCIIPADRGVVEWLSEELFLDIGRINLEELGEIDPDTLTMEVIEPYSHDGSYQGWEWAGLDYSPTTVLLKFQASLIPHAEFR